MAQRLQELCTLLVEDSCGHLCSQIFTTLADHGRLSCQNLQQITRIPGRQLRPALAVLLQQHLILHYAADVDLTFYQVDWRNAYYLIRSSRIVALTQDRYGEGAGRLVANLLQLGHASVGDLAQAFDLEPVGTGDVELDGCLENGNGQVTTNGMGPHITHSIKITTVSRFHRTLRTLLRAGFLIKVSQRVYMPVSDLQHEIEEAVISDQFPDRKVTGPKKQTEFKVAVNNLKRKWRDAYEYSDSRDLSSKGIIRRPGMTSNKRIRTNGTLPNGLAHNDDDDLDGADVAKLPNDMVLQVNYARLTLASRSHRLEQFAESYLGGATSHVYGALLQVLESKSKHREDNIRIETSPEDDEEDLPVATTSEVAEVLDPAMDLSLGILGLVESQRLPNGDGKQHKKGKRLDPEFADIGIKQEDESDRDDDHPAEGLSSYRGHHRHMNLVEEHLKLLEEHAKGFCRRIGGGGRGEWRVDFSALTSTLVQAEVDSTVLARFGKLHARIVRILRERGRLEEKQMASFSMLRMKDVRSILTELQEAGIIEAQEVPRDASRQPSKTVYLWFHDQSRVQGACLQHTYQAIARTFQRLKQERQAFRGVIEKAELLGSKQDELLQNEKNDLMLWREIEEKLLIQVQKMDDMVALFRDFLPGKDTSLIS